MFDHNSRKINVPIRTDLQHFCVVSNYHHIVVNKAARRLTFALSFIELKLSVITSAIMVA